MGNILPRPLPPSQLLDPENYKTAFMPAYDIVGWLKETIFNESSPLYNEDHTHLDGADIAFMWTAVKNTRQTKHVVGQCEELVFRCGAWQKGRQEQQMRDWFGGVPEYLITIDAFYAAQCDDIAWCALIEHELYHIAHERDEFNAPKFNKMGMPKLVIQAHDVEEFVGIVRRYGANAGAGKTQELIAAAQNAPEIGQLNISQACGTCLRAT